MSSGSSFRLHSRLLVDPDVTERFAGPAHLQALLDVEAALATAEATVGVIPAQSVGPIEAAARAELYDVPEIAREAANDGNVVIPLVRHLTAAVATRDPDAARYVHWGATSQDILDTALVLQLRSTVPTVAHHLRRATRAAREQAHRHADATMAGRTWLQQATPITFGLKAAGWADALHRTSGWLDTMLQGASVLQFGGAAGTLASLGSHGLEVADALAVQLGLTVPPIPWHTHRDRLAQLGCALGVAMGTVGKIGRDISLLAQTEVGEVTELSGPSRGGSSTMPHKRNPVSASVALAAAGRTPGLVATLLGAMLQEHERGVGGWQVEWDTLPDLVQVSAGGARAIADALEGLTVHPDRMGSNLDASGGVTTAESVAMALAESVGKHDAHDIVATACRQAQEEGLTVAEALAKHSTITRHLDPATIADRLSPAGYLGVTHEFIARVLSRVDRDG